MLAGSRLSGSLRARAGYDDSILQDATALGGPLVESGCELAWAGRAFRDLSASLSGQVNTLKQPSVPTQDLSELAGQGRLAWRFFDCLSPLIEATATQWKAPQAAALDSDQLTYAGGLRGDFLSWGCLELLAQAGLERYPHSDLGADTRGGEARLDADLSETLDLRVQVQRLTRYYIDRHDYSSAGTIGPNLREDQDLHWNAALTWAPVGADRGIAVQLRGERLDSHGQSVDYGPGQNQYHDLFFPTSTPGLFLNDDTVVKDYFSRSSSGGGLSAWWQGHGWGLQAQGGLDETQFLGRIARSIDGNSLPGAPLRHDQVLQGGLNLDVPFSALNLDWVLDLDWSTWGAASNDSLYSYQRNLTSLGLALFF